MTADRYRLGPMRSLADQLRVAPRRLRIQYIERAERFLAEVERETVYPFAYVAYRITGFYPQAGAGDPLPGRDLSDDLARFIEELSGTLRLPISALNERWYRVDELARELNVSIRTLRRWRCRGLVGRRYYVEEGRSVLVYTESTLLRFLDQNKVLVVRAGQFTNVTEEERETMVRLAKELTKQKKGAKPSEVVRAVAAQTGRAPETVRRELKRYDEENPDRAVFPDRNARLTWEDKEQIFTAYNRGTPIAALAKRYGKSPATIRHAVLQVRARRLKETPIEYMYNEEFDQPGADEKILGPEPVPEKEPKRTRAPKGLPPYLASLYEVPLLTKEQEVYLFRKMNYLKHKAKLLQDKIDVNRPRASDLDELERLLQEALEVKNRIIRSNLRLVVSIAKRHVTPQTNLFELVSDGNMSLIRAVEKFDYSRGFKFSTYASWAIMKNFARSIPEEAVRRDRFVTGYDEIFDTAADRRSDPYHEETSMREIKNLLYTILDKLDEREQHVIIARFGLGQEGTPRTLEQVGRELGVTKERVRQLESRALKKLQAFAAEHGLELVQ